MNKTLSALATILALACGPVLADRPLVSETADVIPTGTCQVETAAARATSSGSPSATGLNAVFSCGLGGIHQAARSATAAPAPTGRRHKPCRSAARRP